VRRRRLLVAGVVLAAADSPGVLAAGHAFVSCKPTVDLWVQLAQPARVHRGSPGVAGALLVGGFLALWRRRTEPER
jgi:hypothetical protein